MTDRKLKKGDRALCKLAPEINAEIELSVYGPNGSEQASAASSWETAKLLAKAFERIEQLEALVEGMRISQPQVSNAAALRAAVAATEMPLYEDCSIKARGSFCEADDLLAIADELEAH